MKQLFFIIFAIFVLSCTKDENTVSKIETGNITYAAIDVSYTHDVRSGVYIPFNYPISQVTFHDFQFIYLVQNQQLLDSTVYDKKSNDRSKRYGIFWYPYQIVYYYKDGSINKEISNCPETLGNHYVKYPDLNYNQVNISNPENWIKIERTTRKKKWYSDWCGVQLDQWVWHVTTSSGVDVVEPIDPTVCSGYGVLGYQLIF